MNSGVQKFDFFVFAPSIVYESRFLMTLI